MAACLRICQIVARGNRFELCDYARRNVRVDGLGLIIHSVRRGLPSSTADGGEASVHIPEAARPLAHAVAQAVAGRCERALSKEPLITARDSGFADIHLVDPDAPVLVTVADQPCAVLVAEAVLDPRTRLVLVLPPGGGSADVCPQTHPNTGCSAVVNVTTCAVAPDRQLTGAAQRNASRSRAGRAF